MLSQHLIERALSLTGKTMEGISVTEIDELDQEVTFMAIEKLCYYLLSPEFIEKYSIFHLEKGLSKFSDQETSMFRFAKAIYEYQLGNEEPLVELLSKI